MDQAIYPTTLTDVELRLLHALGAGSSNKHSARSLGNSEFRDESGHFYVNVGAAAW